MHPVISLWAAGPGTRGSTEVLHQLSCGLSPMRPASHQSLLPKAWRAKELLFQIPSSWSFRRDLEIQHGSPVVLFSRDEMRWGLFPTGTGTVKGKPFLLSHGPGHVSPAVPHCLQRSQDELPCLTLELSGTFIP